MQQTASTQRAPSGRPGPSSWGWGLAVILGTLLCVGCAQNEGATAGGGGVEGIADRRAGAADQYTGGPPYPGACVKSGDSRADGSIEWTLSSIYNADGQPIRQVYDHGADGSADTIYRYEYEGGHLVEKTKDSDTDGEPEVVETFGYDEQGRRVERIVDMNADGYPEKAI